jgi:rapamycin-insensitive companion of mTOR
MSQIAGLAASVTPTQANIFRHGRSLSHQGSGEIHGARDGSYGQKKEAQDSRSLANNLQFGPRGTSLAASTQLPGSFSSDLKTVTLPRTGTPRADLGTFANGGNSFGAEGAANSEQRQKELRDKINKEIKIKIGSENLLEALISKNAKQTRDQRQKVESELTSSNRKLLELNSRLEDEIEHAKRPTTPSRDRLSGLFQGSPITSPMRDSLSQEQLFLVDQESESPTYLLAEILQALEVEGMQPDYYIERANHLVDLFKRYPNLKYDLAWPSFGLRVQTMLLSESREVIAAGYRVTRHAIADRKSLQTIRDLNTDSLVILSLIKENKASIEREQALKFVRAFLDVKDGIQEISNAVVRTVVAVAEHHEDRLRNMSLMTISEILLREPMLVVNAGGIGPLADALVDGSYHGPESLAMTFLHLLDKPKQRIYLQSGYELDSAYTPFTDPSTAHENEGKLRSSARLIAAILKTWPGFFSAASRNFQAIKSLLQSLQYPNPLARDLILDLLFDVLHILPPSWTSSFLAGRRLTTYGRVANFKTESNSLGPNADAEEEVKFNLMDHFTTLLLASFMHCGLVQVGNRPSEQLCFQG